MDTGNHTRNTLKKAKTLWIVSAIAFVLLLCGVYALGKSSGSKNTPDTSVTLDANAPKKNLNKTFHFAVKDNAGNEITKITYTILSIELQHEIIISGQKASAIKGKIFLILNLQLTNNFNKNIQINSRDYVRLTVNNTSDLFAPELHNDPIQVDAISTKYTRLGFTINETDKNLVLHVGEIDGKKTALPIDFTK